MQLGRRITGSRPTIWGQRSAMTWLGAMGSVHYYYFIAPDPVPWSQCHDAQRVVKRNSPTHSMPQFIGSCDLVVLVCLWCCLTVSPYVSGAPIILEVLRAPVGWLPTVQLKASQISSLFASQAICHPVSQPIGLPVIPPVSQAVSLT